MVRKIFEEGKKITVKFETITTTEAYSLAKEIKVLKKVET